MQRCGRAENRMEIPDRGGVSYNGEARGLENMVAECLRQGDFFTLFTGEMFGICCLRAEGRNGSENNVSLPNKRAFLKADMDKNNKRQ